MSEWESIKLKEIVLKIGSGATPRGGGNSYKETGIPLIRSQNILDLEFSYDGLAFIDDLQASMLNNVIIFQNDLLLNITGDSVARICMVPLDLVSARVNQHVAIIRIDEDKADSHYILYFLKSIEQHLLAISEIGGTRRALTKGMIEELDILYPPLPEQKAIAGVLSSLDDKIDLLHRQNKTLEAMAETLFRQWFIEEAEDDWETKTLNDILTVKGGSTPSTANPSYWNGNIHWTTPKDVTKLNHLHLFDTERKITEEGLRTISSGQLPAGTLLMTSRAPVGVLTFAEIPIAINQGYIAIIDNKGIPKELIYLWLKANMDYVHSFSNGSTFEEISKSSFKSLKLSVPPQAKIKDFQEIVVPLFEKIKTNSRQMHEVVKLRDTLLPRFMSGEVKVDI